MSGSCASARVCHVAEGSHTRATELFCYIWWDNSNTGASDASISALKFWDTPLKNTTCALLMLHSLLILVQTPLHNLQNSGSAEHLSKLLWLLQASQNLTSNSTEMWRMPSQVRFVIISCAVSAKNIFHSQVQACRALCITVVFTATIKAAEQDNTLHIHSLVLDTSSFTSHCRNPTSIQVARGYREQMVQLHIWISV